MEEESVLERNRSLLDTCRDRAMKDVELNRYTVVVVEYGIYLAVAMALSTVSGALIDKIQTYLISFRSFLGYTGKVMKEHLV